ncbi:MAG: hypothetical protein JJU05_15485, partial [Verrucomicrobia bacterium]|nr:hypothetical protein [Verrucomicrobiota bacterium]
RARMARVRLLKAGGAASCGGGPGQDGPRPAVESWRHRILRREDLARMARVRQENPCLIEENCV